MTAVAEDTVQTSPELPVLLGLAELTALFPQFTKQSIYRWRTRKNLPEPVVVVSGTPMWSEDTILAWAEETHRPVNKTALRKIRREQGH